MPRIRTIKPEFWGDEKLAPLPPIDRLVFQGLISMADDAGRLVDNIKSIDGFIFPESEDTSRGSLDTLARLSRIHRYQSASGQRLIQIVHWKRHQKVDKPSKYVLPAPTQSEPSQEDSEGSSLQAADTRETVANVSSESRETVASPARESGESVAESSRSDLGPTTNDRGPTTGTAQQQLPRAREPEIEPIDSHPRWPELAAKFACPAEVEAVLDCLNRGSAEADNLLPILINWCNGELLPPHFAKRVTPLVIAAALQEYKGNFNRGHIWAFITQILARWEKEAAGSGSSVAVIASIELGTARKAARVWRLIKREGLINGHPDLRRQRIEQLANAGEIVDAAEFLKFMGNLKLTDLSRAYTDNWAEKIVAEALAICPIQLPEAA